MKRSFLYYFFLYFCTPIAGASLEKPEFAIISILGAEIIFEIVSSIFIRFESIKKTVNIALPEVQVKNTIFRDIK